MDEVLVIVPGSPIGSDKADEGRRSGVWLEKRRDILWSFLKTFMKDEPRDSFRILPPLAGVILPREKVPPVTKFGVMQVDGGLEVLENQVLKVLLTGPLIEEKSIFSKVLGLFWTPDDYWHLSAISFEAVQASGLTGAGTLVGILDTGIAPKHDELDGRLWTTAAGLAYAEFDRVGQRTTSQTVADLDGHGSHVSGLIAGKTCGIAPAASLAVASIFSRNGGGTETTMLQFAAGFSWLLENEFRSNERGVDVINCSVAFEENNFMESAIELALKHSKTLVVAGIGDSKPGGPGRPDSPGNYSAVLGVGAVSDSGGIADFSPRNDKKPDLYAPGIRVLSASSKGDLVPQSGTSMSTAIVTGAAALLLEKDPALRHDAIALRDKLLALTYVPKNETHRILNLASI